VEISAIEFSGLEVAGSSVSLKVSDFSDDSSPKFRSIFFNKNKTLALS